MFECEGSELSKVIYYNVLNTEIQGMDRMEMMMDIYKSREDFRTQPDSNTNRQQPIQSTGSECVMKRSYRSVSVCLVLLCVLLLTAVIVLCVLINTNKSHIMSKNITEERDELIAKYNNITQLSEQLNQKINGLWTHLHDGWIYYQSSLYFISSEEKSWTESRRYCRERGADLIIINNKEEQDFIKKNGGGEHWIGLTDSDEEGRWKWVDGSTLSSRFWGSGEPNGEREENCASSFYSGWYDNPCKKAYKWICESRRDEL